MHKTLLILVSLFTFLSASLKCETICVKDTGTFKFRKNIKYFVFKNDFPYTCDWVVIDTTRADQLNIITSIPYPENPKESLIGIRLVDYELSIETSPDRYPIRKYFDWYTEGTIHENPDLNITQLYIDGMARNPYIIIKLEGYRDLDLNKKISSLWFGIRMNRKISYIIFIFKGKKIDPKKEESLIKYLKDFEIVEE